jgi:DNA-binding NarL/FixJ family response regulator
MNNLPKISIIIADDHPAVRYGVISILEELDFIESIHEADNGATVLKLLEERNYDLILLDIAMPHMDGIATAKIIRKAYPTVKIVGFSCHNEQRYIEELNSIGAYGYILKYADANNIVKGIRRIVEGYHYSSNEIKKQNDIFKNSGQSSQHEEILRIILFLLCQQKSSKQIAGILKMSIRTIETYRSQLTEITGAKNTAGLIRYGIENRIHEDHILINKYASILI